MNKLVRLALLGLVACGPAPKASLPELTETSTTPIDLSRPTIVAYFVASADQIARNPDLASSFTTFQSTVDFAEPEAQRRSIQFIVTHHDSLRLRWDDGREKTYATADAPDQPVGYHFFRPGATPVTLPQEYTGDELLKEIARYFDSPLPPTRSE